MTEPTFPKTGPDRVTTYSLKGITSAAPGRMHKVPKNATVKVYPTAAGTATVYSTNTEREVSRLDEDNAGIVGSVNADWDEWDAGAVTAKKVQTVLTPVETVALVVTSGTWTIEVSV